MFGYERDARVLGEIISVQVAEAVHSETLAPLVALFYRFDLDEDQIGVTMPPDLADSLADELHRWADRARAKSIDPPQEP